MYPGINARRGPLIWAMAVLTLAAIYLTLAGCSGTPQPSATTTLTGTLTEAQATTLAPTSTGTLPEVQAATLTTTSTRTLLPAQGSATLTPTPTKVIVAVEATPTEVATSTPAPNTWEGTIHSSTTGNYAAAGTCTGETWDMQFQVQVATDGNVTGKGSGKIGSNPTCSGPGFVHSNYLAHQAKSLEFSVRGTRTDREFKLQLTETKIDGSTAGLINYALLVSLTNNPPVLVVPISSPSSAQGETDVVVPVPDSAGVTVSAKHQVTMTCTTCN